MAQASPSLQWLLLRNHTSFIVKRDGAVFTREPNNLYQKNSYKFSGLANNNVVGVNANNKGGVVVSRRTRGRQGRVASANASLTVNKTQDFKRVARSVKAATKNSGRRDLENAALARWTRVNRTLRKTQKAAKKEQAVVAK